ncbi:MAG TPA: response regulator [Pyrinomonadaceae bacterium]|jgi:DNA-binding NtrC family response regulator|nr:response regulator [Pyrinomonadaceae bacterium]
MATVLIVDDDRLVREMLCDLLEEQHTCHMAATAEAALTLMQEENYDVVLSDIAMPELSGIDLLGLIRANYPTTPVIVITGSMLGQEAEELFKQGAFDYLMKPLQLDEIERSVSRALQRRQMLLSQMR